MNKFRERMEELSDAHLLDIIRRKQEYQADAVAAAYAEINHRDLKEADFVEELDELARAREPLTMPQKLGFFFGAPTLVPWFFRMGYMKNGYRLKYRSAGILLKLGFAFYLGAYGIYLGYANNPVTPQEIWDAVQPG